MQHATLFKMKRRFSDGVPSGSVANASMSALHGRPRGFGAGPICAFGTESRRRCFGAHPGRMAGFRYRNFPGSLRVAQSPESCGALEEAVPERHTTQPGYTTELSVPKLHMRFGQHPRKGALGASPPAGPISTVSRRRGTRPVAVLPHAKIQKQRLCKAALSRTRTPADLASSRVPESRARQKVSVPKPSAPV